MRKIDETVELSTPFEEDMPEIPYASHPRPGFMRDGYVTLNGDWDLTVTDGKKIKYSGIIKVPFPPESRLSGVSMEIGKRDVMRYTRRFNIENSQLNGKILLHLDAVDQTCTVYVNSQPAGKGDGGYLPHTFDVTELVVCGENVLTVEARDPLDKKYPYGKQTDKRGGMWYTKVSGIWQSVWLEFVPSVYVEGFRMTPDLCGVHFFVFGGEDEKHLSVETESGMLEASFTGDEYYLSVPSPHLWSPEDPYLYYFTLRCGDDVIKSYFALRTFGITEVGGTSYLALNGKPYFLHGLLDQGYYSDGIFLPATEEGYRSDILKMKSCGFNMLRKHIKTEPQVFYHYCDMYGMIVFQDMINNGPYSFIRDTALPTVGIRRGIKTYATRERKEKFIWTAVGIQSMLYNNPSVCYYTIFNEGWGQFGEVMCYGLLRKLDPTRVYDTASGWFKTLETDVESDHVYFRPVRLKPVRGRPMVLSEFGGYSCKIDGHSFNLKKNYGYRFFKSTDELEGGLVCLYENEILPHIEKGLSAAVLTQVSDVEDETNGLLTYDRRVLKVNADRMTALADRLYAGFEETVKKHEI
ncbi:MAG: glycoside hydrolase family 2 [Clostridia bacterium]|nr:glycoside hydrolase family 2 [Clostridia bacterium]